MSDTKVPTAPISREWAQYLGKAIINPDNDWPVRPQAEIDAYKGDIRQDYECQLFALPTPIATFGDVTQVQSVIFRGKELRFYPPFALNEKSYASGSFSEVAIPEGIAAVEKFSPIPKDAVTGLRAGHGLPKDGVWARGLRVDVQTGADVLSAISLLLDHICQFTRQWWVRGTHDPFLGFQRFGAAVNREFRTLKLFTYEGATKIESPWYGTTRYQPNLGSAAVLDRPTWVQVCQHVTRDDRADIGILGIHDAFADYMSGRDEKCILNLCIGVEILLNKHWQFVLKKPANDRLDKILRQTSLIDQGSKEVLKKLIIDRGHVAHGRAPHIVSKEPGYTIETYLQAGKTVLDEYLSSIPQGAWPTLMNMRLNRTN
jgi:hypothetical protein